MSNVNDPGHGHSVAAWISVVVMLVAVMVGTITFFLAIEWLVWASAGLLVVGALLWIVLAKLGFGADRHAGASEARS